MSVEELELVARAARLDRWAATIRSAAQQLVQADPGVPTQPTSELWDPSAQRGCALSPAFWTGPCPVGKAFRLLAVVDDGPMPELRREYRRLRRRARLAAGQSASQVVEEEPSSDSDRALMRETGLERRRWRPPTAVTLEARSSGARTRSPRPGSAARPSRQSSRHRCGAALSPREAAARPSDGSRRCGSAARSRQRRLSSLDPVAVPVAGQPVRARRRRVGGPASSLSRPGRHTSAPPPAARTAAAAGPGAPSCSAARRAWVRFSAALPSSAAPRLLAGPGSTVLLAPDGSSARVDCALLMPDGVPVVRMGSVFSVGWVPAGTGRSTTSLGAPPAARDGPQGGTGARQRELPSSGQRRARQRSGSRRRRPRRRRTRRRRSADPTASAGPVAAEASASRSTEGGRQPDALRMLLGPLPSQRAPPASAVAARPDQSALPNSRPGGASAFAEAATDHDNGRNRNCLHSGDCSCERNSARERDGGADWAGGTAAGAPARALRAARQDSRARAVGVEAGAGHQAPSPAAGQGVAAGTVALPDAAQAGDGSSGDGSSGDGSSGDESYSSFEASDSLTEGGGGEPRGGQGQGPALTSARGGQGRGAAAAGGGLARADSPSVGDPEAVTEGGSEPDADPRPASPRPRAAASGLVVAPPASPIVPAASSPRVQTPAPGAAFGGLGSLGSAAAGPSSAFAGPQSSSRGSAAVAGASRRRRSSTGRPRSALSANRAEPLRQSCAPSLPVPGIRFVTLTDWHLGRERAKRASAAPARLGPCVSAAGQVAAQEAAAAGQEGRAVPPGGPTGLWIFERVAAALGGGADAAEAACAAAGRSRAAVAARRLAAPPAPLGDATPAGEDGEVVQLDRRELVGPPPPSLLPPHPGRGDRPAGLSASVPVMARARGGAAASPTADAAAARQLLRRLSRQSLRAAASLPPAAGPVLVRPIAQPGARARQEGAEPRSAASTPALAPLRERPATAASRRARPQSAAKRPSEAIRLARQAYGAEPLARAQTPGSGPAGPRPATARPASASARAARPRQAASPSGPSRGRNSARSAADGALAGPPAPSALPAVRPRTARPRSSAGARPATTSAARLSELDDFLALADAAIAMAQ